MIDEVAAHEDKVFENIDYTEKRLRNREFLNCRFVGCLFYKSDLSGNSFEACIFENCNLSMATIVGVGLRDITFKGCKIMGVDFTKCNTLMFSFQFENCVLDYSTFFGTKIKKTSFLSCSLKEVDFTNANLTASVFSESNLFGSIFDHSNLEKTDFRGAVNFSIEPENNRMSRAKFSPFQLEGLLHKYRLDIEGVD